MGGRGGKADAAVLNTAGATRAGSNPAARTPFIGILTAIMSPLGAPVPDIAKQQPPFQRTVAGSGRHEIEIRKSRFIGAVARAATEEEARAFIEGVRKRHWDANHNCTAWAIGPGQRSQRSSDDGEPSGTAGVPMLEVLKRRGVTDTVAVVTRYFGGIKLGAGGLIRAYGQAVSETLDVVGIVERRPLEILRVTTPYEDAGRIENAIRASTFPLGTVDYGVDVTFELALAPDEAAHFRAWIAELSGGQAKAVHAGTRCVEVPV